MRVWANELKRIGFRKLSERYWQCTQRFGLPRRAHASIFQPLGAPTPRSARRRQRASSAQVDVSAFHVTFELLDERVHVYYRETDEGVWEHEGHTPRRDFERLGGDFVALRAVADHAARRIAQAMGGVLRPRGLGGPGDWSGCASGCNDQVP